MIIEATGALNDLAPRLEDESALLQTFHSSAAHSTQSSDSASLPKNAPATGPKSETNPLTKKAFDRHDNIAVVATGGFIVLMYILGKSSLRDQWPLMLPLLTWLCCTITMNIMNKLAVTAVPFPLALVSIQMLVAALGVLLVGGVDLVKELRQKPRNVLYWCTAVGPFCIQLTTSMLAIEEGSISTVLVVRNMLPFFALLIEKAVMPNDSVAVTAQTLGSLAIIASGTFLYTYYDYKATHDWAAILCIVLNMVFTVVTRIMERKILIDPCMDLSTIAMCFLNQFAGFIVITAVMGIRDPHIFVQLETLTSAKVVQEPTAVACVIISGLVGLSLNFNSVIVQKQISATSMLAMQTSVKVMTILLAMALFRDHFSWATGLGCVVSLAGSAWYGAASRKPPAKAAPPLK
jgi:drug/metabolite transporter (DMT)-like permease